ncbi:MFS transporter [Actinacidiphila paucisporea]|uniref:Predicted arabinose efflux permease, MFS family n=1 Tax=Actinacidiphila paucisporea TaxID=310782 RepID=A0A1M7FV84_9ACTN|nr:MFS transporter [Actinacidiphila paucisporea]SHM07860.1 Predicted arabinose efflux permease, MFS family [Actinacidiphila paucisporea]
MDRRPLAIPAYRRLWLASAVGAVGGSFSVVAIPAQLFAVTGSSAAVGASAAVSLVALVAAALWTGAVADARDRRTVLLAAHCGLALTYTGLWAQAALGRRSVPVLLVLVACQGLTLGAVMTTMGAAVPRLVPAGLLPAANSLSSLVRYAGSILGPVLAGALIPLVGLGTLYLCDAVALLAVVWAVVRLPPLPPRPGPARSTPGRVLAGFRYVAGSRLLVAVLAVDLAAMVFGMPVALFPELARHTYGGPAGGGTTLGLLYAAYPAGVFAIGLASGTFTRATRHGALLAVAATAWGAGVVLLGLASRLWLALTALVLGGAVNFVLSTFRNALTQALGDDALRGRVQGSLTVVTIGGPQVGNLLHGAAGSAFGARPVICAGGLLTTLTVLAIVWRVPGLRRYTATAPSPRPAATSTAAVSPPGPGAVVGESNGTCPRAEPPRSGAAAGGA